MSITYSVTTSASNLQILDVSFIKCQNVGFIKKVNMVNLFIEEYDRLSNDAVTYDPPSEDLVPAIRSTGFATQMRFITILKFT